MQYHEEMLIMKLKVNNVAIFAFAIAVLLVLEINCAEDDEAEDDYDAWLFHGVEPETTPKAEEEVPDPKEKQVQGKNSCDGAVEQAKKGCPMPQLLPRGLTVKNRLNKAGELYLEGQEVQFDCAEGFILSYEDAVVCQPDGTWSGHLPVCLRNWAEPRIVKAPKTSNKLELSCVSGKPKAGESAIMRAECTKNEVSTLKSDLWTLNTKEGKYTTRAKKTWGVKDIQGHYACFCRLQDGKVLHQITSLFEDTNFRFRRVPQDITLLKYGEDVPFHCVADDAVITWMWEDGVLYHDSDHHALLPDGTLLIMDIQLDQVGQYTCVAEHVKTKQKIRHSVQLNVQAPANQTCGKATEKKMKRQRIFGGAVAPKASHPWMAYIQIGKEPRMSICGGSLVDYKYIMTAAHCVYNIETEEEFDVRAFTVTLGKHQRRGIYPGELRVDIESIYSHPAYDPVTKDFDVAILALKEPVTFTDTIRPICLPKKGFLDEAYRNLTLDARVFGMVAGWGRQSNTDPWDMPEELMHIRLPLVSQDQCLKSAKANAQDEMISDNMFCAGADGMDSCQGDSGGPYEMKKGDRTYLAGVVSFGLDTECGAAGQYGYYAKVENFVDQAGDLNMHEFISGR